MAILATRGLTKRYGATLALEGLDLEIEPGGIFGFLGANGSGKTTTIRLLLGLLRPTSGEARILGHDCWRAGDLARREVGYLPGDLRLWPRWSGERLLSLFGRARGRDLRPEGRRLAEKLGLDLSIRARAMSKGNRQKLGLVLALAHQPRLVVLDEPTTGLDPVVRVVLEEHLRALAARGHTIFFSSHSLAEVEQICDRVAILVHGRRVLETGLDELRRRARREVSIRWAGPASAPERSRAPAGLEITESGPAHWSGFWTGATGDLVRWLGGSAALAVEDVGISPPDLADLFHEHYRE